MFKALMNGILSVVIIVALMIISLIGTVEKDKKVH